jgi:hypothetical protein
VASGVGSPSSRGRGVAVLWAVVRCSAVGWVSEKFLLIFGKEQRAKRKERAEKRESREKKREKNFRRNERRERNFWNKKTLVRVGSDQKNIGFLIFTKCTVAFQK